MGVFAGLVPIFEDFVVEIFGGFVDADSRVGGEGKTCFYVGNFIIFGVDLFEVDTEDSYFFFNWERDLEEHI